MATVQGTQENLQRETSSLVTALRRTSVRARWGELTLRRVVELAGMVEYCDFEDQPIVGERETQVRPDMIIRIPGGVVVPVDYLEGGKMCYSGGSSVCAGVVLPRIAERISCKARRALSLACRYARSSLSASSVRPARR